MRDGSHLMKSPLELGRVVITRGVDIWAKEDPVRMGEILLVLGRHSLGDWGDVPEEDEAANNRALKEGARVLSSYVIEETKVWVITEWDRSVTTVLFPEEY